MGLLPLLLIVLIFVAIGHVSYSNGYREWMLVLLAVSIFAITAATLGTPKSMLQSFGALVLAASGPTFLGALVGRTLQVKIGFGAVILGWLIGIMSFGLLAVIYLQQITNLSAG